MRLGLAFYVVALLALQAAVPDAQLEPTKPDAEFSLTVERGEALPRPRVRLRNRTTLALAICNNSINFDLWRRDGSTYGGGAEVVEGVGGSRCGLVENWSVVPPSESWVTVLELPAQPALHTADELRVRGVVRVGTRIGDMTESKLGLYLWQGTLGQLKESREAAEQRDEADER
jgi:hypothetical protein